MPFPGNELRILLAKHLAAENAHDLDAVLSTLHPDCVFEDLATGQTWRGHAGAASHYRQWWDAFDVAVEPRPEGRSRWCDDGTYVGEARFVGTHRAPIFGVAATERHLDLPFVVLVGFRDGLMASERFYYDGAALLRQIGVPVPKLEP
ncbi:MAG TPA: ester cyclase [Woeseiaceae bacterium]|nr:ester cyclase [Woeseiaceae bacterium]